MWLDLMSCVPSDVCRIFNDAATLPVNWQLTKIADTCSLFYHSSNYNVIEYLKCLYVNSIFAVVLTKHINHRLNITTTRSKLV